MPQWILISVSQSLKKMKYELAAYGNFVEKKYPHNLACQKNMCCTDNFLNVKIYVFQKYSAIRLH